MAEFISPLKVFTTLFFRFAKNYSLTISAIIFMILMNRNNAQTAVDVYGSLSGVPGLPFRLNGFESNPSNLNSIKDWEFGLSLGSSFTSEISNNIYQLTLSKKIGDHYFYARYSPGIKKEFNFKSGATIIFQDDVKFEQELQTNLRYEELFGFGYSFKFSNKLNAGFNLRYFGQEFSEERPDLIFSDTLNFISITNVTTNRDFWRADIGLDYFPSPQFGLSLSSVNLINALESTADDAAQFEMKNEKAAKIGVYYQPVRGFNLSADYETTNSFSFGLNQSLPFLSGVFTFGISSFHDKYQQPYICAVSPAINYSSDFFSISIAGIKYFSDRTAAKPLNEFLQEGINDVFNNQYSFDKLFLSVNVALSFIPEQKVKFVDVEIEREIFPVLSDEYQTMAFASAKVLNLTDDLITVKPSSYIPKINEERVFSPQTILAAGDTGVVSFFTTIKEDLVNIDKREIVQAEFYINTSAGEPDDIFQKPLLINDINSWDGKVITLRYFVKSEYNYSLEYAKNILSNFKSEIDAADPRIKNFEKVRILFNQFIKEMLYVADPRASVERVQFPNQTIKLKGGDCDDLSVAFSSLLESIGIQTAFVDYKSDEVSHVNLLINTNLVPDEAALITANDRKYFIRKNLSGKEEIWIPLEMTSLTDFPTAWSVAASKFYSEAVDGLGLAKGTIQIVDIY